MIPFIIRWTKHGSGLSNTYYENLADFQSGWRQRRTRNGEKWQWTNDRRDFALNSDMSMWINTEVGNETFFWAISSLILTR